MPSDDNASLNEVIRLFDLAEVKIKEVEQLNLELPIPSVNELRYAGYHIARSVSSESEAEKADQLNKAKRHCQRATYDAVEIGIIYLLERIREFQETYYSCPEVFDVIKDYVELCERVEDAKDKLTTIKDGHNGPREDFYQECQPILKDMKAIERKFRLAAPLINVRVDKNNADEKKSTRRFITNISFAGLGIIISFIIAYPVVTS